MKVALLLEECNSPPALPVDTRKGEQFSRGPALNPNAKVPAIDDGEAIVFDSNAILLYLAEKTGLFMPPRQDARRLLSWLMFVATGIGPFSGQCVHFRHAAPEPEGLRGDPLPVRGEAPLGILERGCRAPLMLGDTYRSSTWRYGAGPGWFRSWWATHLDDFPEVKRLLDTINARPAAARVEKLRASHVFKTDMDAEAKKAMFRPHGA